jgi:hypothetical protein
LSLALAAPSPVFARGLGGMKKEKPVVTLSTPSTFITPLPTLSRNGFKEIEKPAPRPAVVV